MPQYEYTCPAGHSTTEIRRIGNRAAPGVCEHCGASTTLVAFPEQQAPPRLADEFRVLVNDRHVRPDVEKKRGRRVTE